MAWRCTAAAQSGAHRIWLVSKHQLVCTHASAPSRRLCGVHRCSSRVCSLSTSSVALGSVSRISRMTSRLLCGLPPARTVTQVAADPLTTRRATTSVAKAAQDLHTRCVAGVYAVTIGGLPPDRHLSPGAPHVGSMHARELTHTFAPIRASSAYARGRRRLQTGVRGDTGGGKQAGAKVRQRVWHGTVEVREGDTVART